MPTLLRTVAAAVRTLFCPRADLVIENLALLQQLAILVRRRPRPRLSVIDRAFRVGLVKLWPGRGAPRIHGELRKLPSLTKLRARGERSRRRGDERERLR